MKCELLLTANGDYPLIRIVDIRNNLKSSSSLWRDFHVNEANEELQKELTQEEIYFTQSVGSKIENTMKKLKLIKFDFGKHTLNKKEGFKFMDVYLTLKNEGGVQVNFHLNFLMMLQLKEKFGWFQLIQLQVIKLNIML